MRGERSRVGRTITAPLSNDPRPVNFAFVSCQDVNEGKLNGYRRMIFEDERAAPPISLGSVLHLGDFIYEVVEYPDEVATVHGQTIYDVGRIPDGGKKGESNFHYPLTVEGYRVVYKGYLADPDLQDARARWPFVGIWDNHEFSWQGRQSIVQAGGDPQPGQTVKVAANRHGSNTSRAREGAERSLDTFGAVAVKNVPMKSGTTGPRDRTQQFKAINSLIAYRTLHYGGTSISCSPTSTASAARTRPMRRALIRFTIRLSTGCSLNRRCRARCRPHVQRRRTARRLSFGDVTHP